MGVEVHMRTVSGKPKLRVLMEKLPTTNPDGSRGFVPVGFTSNGSSSGIFAPIFPRHRHPVAYFRHDWGCENAKNAEERKFEDSQFEINVGKSSWWITKKAGFIGVRIGALFGCGVRY